tara:strand:- start:115 stop:519 length:405 start_codon:yes stop_codon:yes gene_type:complete
MTKNNQPNKGALFENEELKIFKQGQININGDDKDCIVTMRKRKDGKDAYEIYSKMGFININTNKSKETSPDVLGNFDYNTFKFMFAGWKQVKKYDDNTEKKYLSVSVQFDKEQPEKGLNEFEKTDKELDDDIPF